MNATTSPPDTARSVRSADPVLQGLAAGPLYVDRRCYTDPRIFALEQRDIFAHTWQFIAHDSELKQAGEFRTAELAGEPVIAIRGADGQLRLFLNTCRHKGTLLVDAPAGQCEKMKCPYHHWTYDTQGGLISVPKVEAYGDRFHFAENGLVPVARFEVHAGMWFGCLDPDAPPLVAYLGLAAPHLAEIGAYAGQELVALGAYRYSYDANWKLLMENTLDDYHAEYLHDYAFTQRAALFQMEGTSGFQEKEGSRFSLDLGIHGAFDQCDDIRTLTIQTLRERRLYLGIFPSFIALYNPVWDVTSFRIIEPVSVDKTNVLTYCLAPVSATEEQRRAIGERFHYSWGPGGRAGVDDILVFSRVQKGLQARAGGRINIGRGIDRTDPQGGPADDHAVRALWKGWRQYMGVDEAAGAPTC
ncbi:MULTISPECIES: aromatic ring-hydroxylating oxygenase subunit alpha [Pigmentiphaga]|uniref:Benzoate/toluate 1,2-dioxygenase alpha subunit n=1 Tax=Pigmentiphaga kullae TaxID=151784 RepID=A0A4Q7NE35_9BURK|nr:aromatic ring-hydroxylating dioxygenase subunit alpha [Pigmentiphaga kullae]RZS81362.1 benzoate/toluate 1,2-dioxygenase alpha subunit [Pigmentiphaga kullae]